MMKLKSIDLSVIIPVYNECDNVIPLCEEVIQVLKPLLESFEIIFVDDGSIDGTYENLRSLAKNHSNVMIIKHAKNCGQSAAMISGVKASAFSNIVMLDGDGQNDPADIPKLLEFIDHHTVVLGNRHQRQDHWIKRWSSSIANRIRQTWLRDECPDTGCSLKLFPREAFMALPQFNHMHRFLPALFKNVGYQLINVPVNHRPRLHGSSKYGFWNRFFAGIYDLFGVRWLMKRVCKYEIEYDH